MGHFATGASEQQVRPCPLHPDSDQIPVGVLLIFLDHKFHAGDQRPERLSGCSDLAVPLFLDLLEVRWPWIAGLLSSLPIIELVEEKPSSARVVAVRLHGFPVLANQSALKRVCIFLVLAVANPDKDVIPAGAVVTSLIPFIAPQRGRAD